MNTLPWLDWAQRLQAVSQAGLQYSENPFDRERYHQIRAIAAEIISEGMQKPIGEIKDLLDSQLGYATPKIDCRGVVFLQEQILLVKELSDGGWTLPGGWVDVNEPPARAVEREVWEESGYRVIAEKLLAVFDRNQHGFPPYLFHTWKIYFHCKLIGGEAATSIETGGAEFYSEDSIPPLSLSRTTPEIIQRLFEHHRHPEWPTEFD